LRIVPLDPVPAANLYIRDGVDEVAAFGEVVFGGRSPDIIVKQAVVDHPVDEFKDLLDQRPQDTLSLVSDNHVYVRVQNRGVVDADVTLNLYAFPMSAENQPVFTGVPGAWVDLTNPPLHLIIPARGLNYLHVVVPGASLHPVNPNDPYRAFALVALIQAANDPPANLAGIVDVASFWSFFRELPRADNAAIRVLRAVN
jgi:hypothetical protein